MDVELLLSEREVKAMTKTIAVENVITDPVEKVWGMWTEPKHIVKWCYTSDDWEAPYAANDVREAK